MQWFKRNWVWLLMNILAIVPIVGVISVFKFSFSGTEPLLSIDYPARLIESGRPLENISLWWYPIHLTGEFALRWLVVSLSITPLTILFGWKKKTRYRKLFGLYAFGYSAFHFIFFIVDKGIIAIFNEFNSFLALIATLIMIALALTSNNYAIRFMKRNWKRLHRLSYVVAVLAILHVALLEKTWGVYALILSIGFFIRIPVVKSFLIGIRIKRKQEITA